MTDNSKLEMIQDENRLLKSRIKKLENFLISSNAEFIEPAEDPGLLTSDYFNIMSRDYMYRILIESMNEGAVIVNEQKIIVYSNKHFASIIDFPLQKIMGGDLNALFDDENRIILEKSFQTS